MKARVTHAAHLMKATGHHCSCQENFSSEEALAVPVDSCMTVPVAPTVASLLGTANLAVGPLRAAFWPRPSGLPAAKRLAEFG